MFAVFPSISLNNGDLRRNYAPYVITGGISYADMNTAFSAARKLRAMGIACHVDVIC